MRILFWLSFLMFVTAEEILNLPGLDYELNFKQYSGYLDASPTRKLHYWFVESQNDPKTDPLIVWFNGGPGCSSLFGLLQELGPFLINADGQTLHKNEYSWNKNASVVFLESPAGVGFSYSIDGNVTTNDDLASLHNYEAIKHFYSKFPQFRFNDVFIAGESYAGIYIPTLAVRIIDGLKDFDINLKGIAIGNGLVSSQLRFETVLPYNYYHGVMDEDAWESIMECCDGKIDGCSFNNCNIIANSILYNYYDIHSKCSMDKTELPARFENVEYHDVVYMRKLWSSQKLQNYMPESIDDSNQECVPNSRLEQYLNTPEVRDALHVPSTVQDWIMCNYDINTKKYERSDDNDQSENIRKVVGNNIRTLLYYGDVDSVCNFVMGQEFSSRLGLEKTSAKSAWFYDDRIIGGFRTVYDNLTFLTINGAGHMVPQTHPRPMQHILQRFIDGTEI